MSEAAQARPKPRDFTRCTAGRGGKAALIRSKLAAVVGAPTLRTSRVQFEPAAADGAKLPHGQTRRFSPHDEIPTSLTPSSAPPRPCGGPQRRRAPHPAHAAGILYCMVQCFAYQGASRMSRWRVSQRLLFHSQRDDPATLQLPASAPLAVTSGDLISSSASNASPSLVGVAQRICKRHQSQNLVDDFVDRRARARARTLAGPTV